MRQSSPNAFLDRLFFPHQSNGMSTGNSFLQDFKVHEIIILAPVTESLQGIENKTNIPWNETVDNDFIASHILKCSSGLRYDLHGKIKQFTTINGKTVIIKNDFVYTDKGFSSVRHAKLLYDLLYHSGDINNPPYLIYFLDCPLLRSCYDNCHVLKPLSISKSVEKITCFQQILRLCPSTSQKIEKILSNSINELNNLERSNNLSLDNIRQIIGNTIVSVVKTFKSSRTSSIKELLKTQKFTEEDIEILIENYVCDETYDIIFFYLLSINKERNQELMSSIISMEHINIYQVGLPFVNNEIINRVHDSIGCFKQLEKMRIPSEKLNILLKTVRLLVSNTIKIAKESQRNKNYNENMFQNTSDFFKNTLDCDYLIPMLLLVVVRAKLSNLESNFIYMSYFSFLDTHKGEESYALSSLEAVLYHILHQKNKLKEISDCNIILWDSIKHGDINILESIFKEQHPSFNSAFFGEVVFQTKISHISNDIYYYKNINGDSVIMLGIKARKLSSITFLINQPQFSLEVLLNDCDNEGSTLLMVAIKLKFKEAINILLQKLKTCLNQKFLNYLSKKDCLGRTVCHYLFHEPYLIHELGPHLSWKSRDKQGQTPLFMFSTMYNHSDYKKMILDAIEVVQLIENNNLNVDDHVDNNGNSLFHIINDSECLLKLLNCKGNINRKNNYGYTPLICHIKFGRSELVKIFLNDKRTDISAKDQNGFTAIHFSVQRNLETIDILTEVMNIEQRTYTGLTPLHIATQEKLLECIKYLIKNRSADINALDYKGDRPVDISEEQEVINLLDEFLLFKNDLENQEKVVRIVRTIVENDSTIKFVIKSGFINDGFKNIKTVVRTIEDFKLLYKSFIFQYPESWVPSLHMNFLDPCVIPSKPSKSILSAFLNCFDTFLQNLLHHPVFSTNELLWKFITIPQLNLHSVTEQFQNKEIQGKSMSINEINNIDFFLKHTKHNIKNIGHAYNCLHKNLCFLEFSHLGLCKL
ncbi:hypothetical protein PORY_001321 [Pneumocystis oryctolagi]|uniref:Uncharacterized protein n=1 Tax=Pneumocystis oryctolagi TaxID=42067 RepID=A0ACB7CBZ8_9ASCO|nr:hypothetical protein PORY_001321 [Pneumocystis oryctolagi]